MDAKVIEIRDRLTFIPALAVRLDPRNEHERYLLARAGFGISAYEQSQYVELVWLNSGKSACDPYDWRDRTMKTAHQYLMEHWGDVRPGGVVDVQFILGETGAPAVTEGSGEV